MFLVGPYLFSGDDLDAYLTARRADAIAAARARGDGGGAEAVRELFERFRIPETGMHVEKAHFTDERGLTADESEAINVKDEDRHKFKAVTIAIPYSGDEHLFTCRPAVYSAHQPQAEVRDGALHMTWFLSEAEEFQLENNFKRQIALIERTLEVTQWQAMGCNQEIMEALKAELMDGGDVAGESPGGSG